MDMALESSPFSLVVNKWGGYIETRSDVMTLFHQSLPLGMEWIMNMMYEVDNV